MLMCVALVLSRSLAAVGVLGYASLGGQAVGSVRRSFDHRAAVTRSGPCPQVSVVGGGPSARWSPVPLCLMSACLPF